MTGITHSEVPDPEIEANKIVQCLEKGKLTLIGDLIFIKSRECEFEDDHEAGFELRDYTGLVFDSDRAVHLAHVCGLFTPTEDLYLNLPAGAHRFDLISTIPAHDRVTIQ